VQCPVKNSFWHFNCILMLLLCLLDVTRYFFTLQTRQKLTMLKMPISWDKLSTPNWANFVLFGGWLITIILHTISLQITEGLNFILVCKNCCMRSKPLYFLNASNIVKSNPKNLILLWLNLELCWRSHWWSHLTQRRSYRWRWSELWPVISLQT